MIDHHGDWTGPGGPKMPGWLTAILIFGALVCVLIVMHRLGVL